MGFISLLLEIIFYYEKSICGRALIWVSLTVYWWRNYRCGSVAFSEREDSGGPVVVWAMARRWLFLLNRKGVN